MNKANLRGLLTEATSAEEEIVLSDETTAVTTSTAMYDEKNEKKNTSNENQDHIHEDECNQGQACFLQQTVRF